MISNFGTILTPTAPEIPEHAGHLVSYRPRKSKLRIIDHGRAQRQQRMATFRTRLLDVGAALILDQPDSRGESGGLLDAVIDEVDALVTVRRAIG